MPSAEPDWNLYRTFLAVLGEGSLSGAARELGLAQPTVGRHVEQLEQSLDVALFTRSQHGLTPTEAAQQLRPYAEALASTAAALMRVAASQNGPLRGSVRITASEIIGAEVLPPILAQIREVHPDLSIELALNNRVENLLNREADIAVRMVRPEQDALIAKRIGEVPLGLHAHRDYLARRGKPSSLADVAHHSLVGFDRDATFVRAFRDRIGDVDRRIFGLRTDNQLAQFAAIRAGFGIGVCQTGLARRDPNLVRLLPAEFELPLETWLVLHEDLRYTPRCRVVFDALAKGLTCYIEEECAGRSSAGFK
jgi:DNA-binding transcriptional LysR family regulator